jgi:hypothetical protein
VEPLIPRLLSGRNRLSRVEKDQILENVLDEVAPQPKRLSKVWTAVPLVAAAAVIALVPLALWHTGHEDDAFSSRGQSVSVAALSLSCGGVKDAVCSQGDKLLFDLSQSTGYRYFGAFARSEDGTIIWYFPESPEGTSLDLTQRLVDGVLDRGAVLDEHHRPGRYEVYGVFSNEPLTRQSLRSQFDENATNHGGDAAAVVVREITVR